jgi:hypothetical protein
MDIRSWIGKYLKIFGYIVIALFFILALALSFSDYFNYLPQNYRFIFAFLLFSYAAFRVVSIKNNQKSDDDE